MSGNLSVNGLQNSEIYSNPPGVQARDTASGQAAEIQQFEAEIERLLQELSAGQQGPGGQPASPSAAQQPQVGSDAPQDVGASQAAASPSAGTTASDPASGAASGTSTTSAGGGPNAIQITNTTNEPMTIGKFKNGESTTDPSAKITIQPGQTGTLLYQNGEAGYAAKADASGNFQANASRLEYEADSNGKMKYPDVSYIDGRNASISLSDGQGLNKGDTKSIADGAPAGTVQSDAAGNKTIAGFYDGSTAQMQTGAAYMQNALGTGGAYLHPNDDTLPAGQNPMSGTQSDTLHANFGNA